MTRNLHETTLEPMAGCLDVLRAACYPRVERQVGGNMEKTEICLGDIIKLKKQHPCGSQEWEVLRVGMDFRLKCLGCGHQVMLARKQVEKSLRGVRKKEGASLPAT